MDTQKSHPTENGIVRVALYLRIWSKDQSISHQRAVLTAVIAPLPNYEIVAEYEDHALSGDFGRPGYLRMWADADGGVFDMAIAWDGESVCVLPADMVSPTRSMAREAAQAAMARLGLDLPPMSSFN